MSAAVEKDGRIWLSLPAPGELSMPPSCRTGIWNPREPKIIRIAKNEDKIADYVFRQQLYGV
jgi:hypothetical protein